MSAHTPRPREVAKPPGADDAQPADPDRVRPAERAPARHQADPDRSQQSAHISNRADYNAARHAEPPIHRPTDGGRRVPADASARAAGSGCDRRAEHAAPRHGTDAGTRAQPPTESLNRAGYNEARHARPPIQRHEESQSVVQADRQAASTGAEGDYRTGHDAAAQPADADGHTGQRAETRTTEGSGQAAQSEQPGGGPDGSHAADEQPAAERPDTGTDLHPSELEENEKVYVDGHEIEITGDPADGIWIPGLPGEVPDKTGDVLSGPERPKPPGDRFFHAMVDGADDLFDGVEKNAGLAYDALQHPPPASAEVGVPASRHTPEAQHHAPEAGGFATGILALGIMAWAGGRWLDGWISRRLTGAHNDRN